MKLIFINLFFSQLFFIQFVFSAGFIPEKFSANITQVYTSKITKAEKKSTGQVIYQSPHQIYFEITAPDPFTFVANASKSWYFRPPFIKGEKAQLTIKDSAQLGLIKVLDALQKEIISNTLFTVKKNDKFAEITFSADFKKDLEYEGVQIYLKDLKANYELANTEKLVLVKKDKTTVNLFFEKLDVPKENFQATKFIFTAPDPNNTVISY